MFLEFLYNARIINSKTSICTWLLFFIYVHNQAYLRYYNLLHSRTSERWRCWSENPKKKTKSVHVQASDKFLYCRRILMKFLAQNGVSHHSCCISNVMLDDNARFPREKCARVFVFTFFNFKLNVTVGPKNRRTIYLKKDIF